MLPELSRAGNSPDLMFDWKLDIERLERQARQAVQTRRPDDWALVEAECSQDLIAAELTTLKARHPRTEAMTATIEHLQSWSLRVDRVIRQLRSVAHR